MKNLLTIISFLFVFGQSYAHEEIKWTNFNDVTDSVKTNPKPVLIFVTADWCKYCKMQTNSTFSDSTLVKELNENYYCIKLNEQEKNDITFMNRTYKYVTTANGTGYHQLAHLLSKQNGESTFPSTLFLNSNLNFIGKLNGFVDTKTLKNVILPEEVSQL